MPKLQEIINVLEDFAPLHYQESYDNSGLIVGDRETDIQNALLTLDCTEAVIDEAIEKNIQLIIAHHPIVFSGLKSLTGKNYIEKVIIKAIKHDIAIYAAHTNLDHVYMGVNHKIAEKLQLKNLSILDPKKDTLLQFYVYVPVNHAEKVRNALFDAGAGSIGAYSACSFNTQGIGTFLPSQDANPFVGEKNTLAHEDEIKIEVILSEEKKEPILKAMRAAHPYEEIAYGFVSLENKNQYIGAGMLGELSDEMSESQFLALLKTTMKTSCIRHTSLRNQNIKKIAICGGSGSFLLNKAIKAQADIFITADYKYHQFFDAENKLIIADIGHYESEQFTAEIFYDVLSNKFPNFALQITSVNTNPIIYY
ncbi:MAG: Nif3-like dinuclear metal center hexameric protein [Bacteroidetes bacterium]|jgi:dinuclear metal center YbgI/SA1388 family protein|nr:Nif3-like dinuclear metal center hexameric protein [Bacteroidota bacterium]MBK8330236.1 Nif3-like dinuclear metal center hexameric protein [Bacteroidota bacterium]MBK9481024.1 Nif3-like dinuclear metal center hexameric protein [Bacteroidota bacterium]